MEASIEPAPLSNDFRKRLVKAVDGGMSCNAAAATFDVSVSAVVKLMQHRKATGSYDPNQREDIAGIN
jgi:transposase